MKKEQEENFHKYNRQVYRIRKRPVLISAGVFILIILLGSDILYLKHIFLHPEKNYTDIILYSFFAAFFVNLLVYILKRKIVITSEGINNTEIPLFLFFHYSNKIAFFISWEDIEKLEIKKDVVTKKVLLFYIIGKDKKFIAFSPIAIKEGKKLIAYIEEKAEKKFKESSVF